MSSGTVTSEQRKKSRQRPLSLVYVELAHQNGGMMRDLSEEGFAVRAMMPVRVGETTPFSFSLNEGVQIDGEGTIVWVQEKGRVAAVKFTQLSPTARAQIDAWLNGSTAFVPEKPPDVREAPTLEQLREELRASPPRPRPDKPAQAPVLPGREASVPETPVPSEIETATEAATEAAAEIRSQQEHESGVPPERECVTEAEAEPMAIAEEATRSDEQEAPALKEAQLIEPPIAQEAGVEVGPPVVEEAEHGEAVVVEEAEQGEAVVVEEAEPMPETSVQAETASIPAEISKLLPVEPTAAEPTLTQKIVGQPTLAAAEPDSSAHPSDDEGSHKAYAKLIKEPEPAPLNINSLFTPVNELDQQEQALPHKPLWKADGQLPPIESRGSAPHVDEPAVSSGKVVEMRFRESEAGKKSTAKTPTPHEEERPSVPRTAPNLPRLALRLNAADYAKQGFPFAVGPLPPPPPQEPGPQEPPKRFWAATPSTPPATTEERPLSAALRDAFTEPTVPSARPPEPSLRREAQNDNAPILPDISSILIQPSNAARQEQNRELALPAQPLRPWPGQPPQDRSWTENFTLPRAVGIMLLLALVLGVYTYRLELGQGLIWIGEFISGQPSPQTQAEQPQPTADQSGSNGKPANAAPNATSPPATAGGEKSPTPVASAHETQSTASRGAQKEKVGESTIPPEAAPQTSPSNKPKYVIQPGSAGNANSSSAVVSEPNTEAGQAEYQQAMQILRGRFPTYSQAEAVRLLWAAVEKGNPNAELALADMYWHGKSVARNCDQTRILLTAASRKGSAEAQRRLQEFQQEGCE